MRYIYVLSRIFVQSPRKTLENSRISLIDIVEYYYIENFDEFSCIQRKVLFLGFGFLYINAHMLPVANEMEVSYASV